MVVGAVAGDQQTVCKGKELSFTKSACPRVHVDHQISDLIGANVGGAVIVGKNDEEILPVGGKLCLVGGGVVALNGFDGQRFHVNEKIVKIVAAIFTFGCGKQISAVGTDGVKSEILP